MTSGFAQAGGAVAAVGIAAVILAPWRVARLLGLAAWAAGCGALAAWLAPSASTGTYAVVMGVGAVATVGSACLFLRVPWLLVVAILACVPVRIAVSLGGASGHLLLPMYVVVAAAALALAWQLGWNQPRVRELGPVAWPLALLVAWSGIALLWSSAPRAGAVYLLFYVLPFALLAAAVARLRWSGAWAATVYVQLTGMALAFAAFGIWEYATRSSVWRPSAIAADAYVPSGWYYRVASVFDGPSTYARFLVVAAVAGVAIVVFGSRRLAWPAAVAVAATSLGLLPSFSQAGFLALAAAVVVAIGAAWRRRAVVPVAAAAAAVFAVWLGVPQAHSRVAGKEGLAEATSGRSTLVSNGIDAALRHPVIGVGTGGFRETHADVSHDTATTVAAETGLPGLVLLAWLAGTALWVAFRRNVGRDAGARARLAAGLALVAIVVYSLSADTLFTEPLFWVALALTAVAARAPVPE